MADENPNGHGEDDPYDEEAVEEREASKWWDVMMLGLSVCLSILDK